MTAIAGFVHDDGSVWIGGDSAGVAGLDLTVRADAKVFRNGEFLFGFTSSFRMGQLLRYSFVPPALEEKQDISAFMVTTFVDSVRTCLKAGGFAEKDKETERGGEFLVGFRGRLFAVEPDYQVAEPMSRYTACGCGAQVVNGALFATKGMLMDAPVRMRIVLKAAEEHSAGVRGPFVWEYSVAAK